MAEGLPNLAPLYDPADLRRFRTATGDAIPVRGAGLEWRMNAVHHEAVSLPGDQIALFAAAIVVERLQVRATDGARQSITAMSVEFRLSAPFGFQSNL